MSQEKALTHGPEFQRSILKLMMEDDRFTARAAIYLKEGYFSAELRWFFKTIKEEYENLHRPPPADIIVSQINKHGVEAQPYFDEFAKIQATSPQPDYIKRELTGFIRANIFVGAFREAGNLYNQGNRDDAYEVTSRYLEQLLKVDFQKERLTEFGDAPQLIEAASAQKTNAIPTGLKAIDEAMNGGMYPQTWTTFIGGSNAGKSMLMPSLAYYAALHGKRVFVTIHEDEEMPTKLRYLSRFSGVPFTKLLLPYSMLSNDEKLMIEAADATLKEFVKLRFMYSEESTVEEVKKAARMLHKEWPYELFLCDYPQCLTSNRFKSLDNTRLLNEYAVHELKQLCLELGIAGAGGAQANRLGHAVAKKGSDFLRCTDVGESWGIVKKSSNVITINRSGTDANNNRIVFLLDKVRNGRCPVAVECVSDYSRSLTWTTDPDEQGNPSQLELNTTLGPAAAEPEEKEARS